ncbi:unnamed protein product [Dracunculus medinensis]|uniref:Homeobox domain-containing protein n=1 Tax=Dracunculus medinensis TaxID=318479 RepID=A0A158Q5C8_DRAME|nr:unnamed protein product [Dracunculus medinensis]
MYAKEITGGCGNPELPTNDDISLGRQTILVETLSSKNKSTTDHDDLVKSIKDHILYPIIELLLKKCEMAMFRISSKNFEIDDVIQLLSKLTAFGPTNFGDSELDKFLFNTVIMLRIHLMELAKVAELSNDFKLKYQYILKKKMNHDSVIGITGDSDDDIDMMVSIPLWHSETMQNSMIQKVSHSGEESNFMRDRNIALQMNEDKPSMNHVITDDDQTDYKKKTHLPPKAIEKLKTWLFLHALHPYPSENEKELLAKETGLQLGQVNNWFTNARRRILASATISPIWNAEQGEQCNPNSKKMRKTGR